MGKRKKTSEKNDGIFTRLIQEELSKLKFKDLKNIYEEEEADNEVERYIQTAAYQEMKRRNPNWSAQ